MTTDAGPLTALHTVLAMPIGDLTVVREGDWLTGLYFPHHWYRPDPATFGPRTDREFEGVANQLEEYLAGTRTLFDLPLKPRGTKFQLRVWELIAQVPYGQTTTYGDLARRLGGRENAQEVGAAVGRNPLSHRDPLSPGHRQQRQADRLRRRPEAQAEAPGSRALVRRRRGRPGRA